MPLQPQQMQLPLGDDLQKQGPGDIIRQVSTGTAEEEFMATLLDIVDSRGELDTISGAPTPEDVADTLEDDPLGDISREEMTLLITKFMQTSPEFQQMAMTQLQQEDPASHRRIQAAIRLMGPK